LIYTRPDFDLYINLSYGTNAVTFMSMHSGENTIKVRASLRHLGGVRGFGRSSPNRAAEFMGPTFWTSGVARGEFGGFKPPPPLRNVNFLLLITEQKQWLNVTEILKNN